MGKEMKTFPVILNKDGVMHIMGLMGELTLC